MVVGETRGLRLAIAARTDRHLDPGEQVGLAPARVSLRRFGDIAVRLLPHSEEAVYGTAGIRIVRHEAGDVVRPIGERRRVSRVYDVAGLSGPADPAKTDLADRFAGSLEFGTAGLRGVIGAGPNRMNRAVVLRTTWGLAQYLLEAGGPGAAEKGVAIGYDGRRMSKELAEDTACALAAAGVKAKLFDDVVPTPLLAFAVSRLGCAAGVMITASHNPPEYNGYKAYWGNGAQIVPPTDVGIARAIERAPAAKDVPRLAIEEAKSKGLVTMLGEDLDSAYLAEVKKLGARTDGDRTLAIVYTPMHGVGDKLARLAFDQAGFTNVVSVPEQQKPDGAFPTVEFPNPEEKGAMDLAFALANARKADLVIANDPDADRLAVALPSDTSPTGWVQLTGNQVGVLLGHYLLTGGLTSLEQAVKPKVGDPLVIASIVSSPMLGVVAGALGAQYDEVLTGFKWIANRAIERKKKSGEHFVFGFEEALGYTVGELVRDKDGISASVLFAELTAVLRARRDHRPRAPRRPLPSLRALRELAVQPHAEGRRGPGRAPRDHAAAPREPAVEDRRPHRRERARLPEAGRHPRRRDDASARSAEERRARVRARVREPRHRAPERHRAEGEVLLRRARAD